ncbi:hypothetical protein V2A60_008012 [Cordyceps javanica]|uniref:Uncharacterized protein n=1 Tax=Cordyceps javanica TaxID=43265 RepID=A0A545V922_9HYPO|nr:hypothetical protein IF1G_02307 [Cordyceps javanica]TQW09446.1 hypothetical protein IF2G_02236 [Cordyceps javanica]
MRSRPMRPPATMVDKARLLVTQLENDIAAFKVLNALPTLRPVPRWLDELNECLDKLRRHLEIIESSASENDDFDYVGAIIEYAAIDGTFLDAGPALGSARSTTHSAAPTQTNTPEAATQRLSTRVNDMPMSPPHTTSILATGGSLFPSAWPSLQSRFRDERAADPFLFSWPRLYPAFGDMHLGTAREGESAVSGRSDQPSQRQKRSSRDRATVRRKS